MKEILLTKGMSSLVDDEDFEMLSKFKWYAEKTKSTHYAMCYFYNTDKNRKDHYRMHRKILGCTNRTEVIDHIDGNGLNNQKSNLRICTQAQNRLNSKKRLNNKSGFIGVSLFENKVYRARIHMNKKEYHLGYFKTAIEAAIHRDKIAKSMHGEFAVLNFK